MAKALQTCKQTTVQATCLLSSVACQTVRSLALVWKHADVLFQHMTFLHGHQQQRSTSKNKSYR